MEFLKKYKPKHYSNYIDRVDKYIKTHKSIHSMVKSLGLKDIEYLIKSVKFVYSNNPIYFEESAILITILIRMFILELDIDEHQIELKDSDIMKLIYRFDGIIKNEYAVRKEIIEPSEKKYSLLID